MTILVSELKCYKAATINDLSTNGGRVDKGNELQDNILQNNFSHLTPSQLAAGLTSLRKNFWAIDNAADELLNEGAVFLRDTVEGDGACYLIKGDHVDTQGAMAFSDRYGAGYLNLSTLAGANTIEVVVEDPTVIIFRDGDRIRITDGSLIEYTTINGVPSIVGSVVTITLTDNLVNPYSASTSTEISSMIDYGSVVASVSGVVVTSGATGTFDDSLVQIHNLGGIYQQITLTFTTATNFNATGDVLGSLGSGSTGVAFIPVNSQNGQNLLTIPATTPYGGVFQAGDTIVFTITPPMLPFWLERVIPAGSAAQNNQIADVGIYGVGA